MDQKQQNWRAPNGPKTAKLKTSLWTKNSKTEELLMDQKQQKCGLYSYYANFGTLLLKS